MNQTILLLPLGASAAGAASALGASSFGASAAGAASALGASSFGASAAGAASALGAAAWSCFSPSFFLSFLGTSFTWITYHLQALLLIHFHLKFLQL